MYEKECLIRNNFTLLYRYCLWSYRNFRSWFSTNFTILNCWADPKQRAAVKKTGLSKKKVACPDSRAIGIAHYLPRKQNNQKASVACFVLTRQVMTIMYGTSGRELWVGTLFYLFLGTFIKYVQNYFREVDLRHKIFLISIFVCTKDFFITISDSNFWSALVMLILIWNDANFVKTEKIKSIEEPKFFLQNFRCTTNFVLLEMWTLVQHHEHLYSIF